MCGSFNFLAFKTSPTAANSLFVPHCAPFYSRPHPNLLVVFKIPGVMLLTGIISTHTTHMSTSTVVLLSPAVFTPVGFTQRHSSKHGAHNHSKACLSSRVESRHGIRRYISQRVRLLEGRACVFVKRDVQY